MRTILKALIKVGTLGIPYSILSYLTTRFSKAGFMTSCESSKVNITGKQQQPDLMNFLTTIGDNTVNYYDELAKTIMTIEERVRHELINQGGPVISAPSQYAKFGIRWLWLNRLVQRQVTVQLVISDVEHMVPGAWVEIEHKTESMKRPMDSWAKRVYGEVLIYASPNRGQAVIFATRKLRAAFASAWRDMPIQEIQIQSGWAKGYVVPWDTFVTQGTLVTVQ
jgi:hypothetical protein